MDDTLVEAAITAYERARHPIDRPGETMGHEVGMKAALAASAARIEALTEALREIEAHLADHWNCGAVQLFLIASRALVTARAALAAAPRSDGWQPVAIAPEKVGWYWTAVDNGVDVINKVMSSFWNGDEFTDAMGFPPVTHWMSMDRPAPPLARTIDDGVK